MRGFIEERIDSLNVNKGGNQGVLLACGIFFALVGCSVLSTAVQLFLEGDSDAFLAVLFGLVPFGIAFLLIRLYRKRKKRRQEAQSNPYIFVKLHGTSHMAEAVSGFNREYAQEQVRFGVYEKMTNSGFWLTDHYVLLNTGLQLDLGLLESVVWVYADKNRTAVGGNVVDETGNFTLFFQGNDSQADCINLSCDSKSTGPVQSVLEGCGLSISEDKALSDLAHKDWPAFRREMGWQS